MTLFLRDNSSINANVMVIENWYLTTDSQDDIKNLFLENIIGQNDRIIFGYDKWWMRQAGKWLTDFSLAVNLSDFVIMGRSFLWRRLEFKY